MKQLYKAFYGALLVLGLAGVAPVPAFAGGYHWDPACHCRRPDYQYNTRRYVRAPARVITRRHFVTRTQVVRGRTRLVQENRYIVHVRPVINREVVVHRTNTIVRDVLLHRVNTINRWENDYRTEVVNVYEPGWVRHEIEQYEVPPCGCGYRHYSGYYGGRGIFSYRD